MSSKFDEIEEPPKGISTLFPVSSADQSTNVTEALSRLYRILGTMCEGTDVCIDETAFVHGTTIWGFEVIFAFVLCATNEIETFSMAHQKYRRRTTWPRQTPALCR